MIAVGAWPSASAAKSSGRRRVRSEVCPFMNRSFPSSSAASTASGSCAGGRRGGRIGPVPRGRGPPRPPARRRGRTRGGTDDAAIAWTYAPRTEIRSEGSGADGDPVAARLPSSLLPRSRINLFQIVQIFGFIGHSNKARTEPSGSGDGPGGPTPPCTDGPRGCNIRAGSGCDSHATPCRSPGRCPTTGPTDPRPRLPAITPAGVRPIRTRSRARPPPRPGARMSRDGTSDRAPDLDQLARPAAGRRDVRGGLERVPRAVRAAALPLVPPVGAPAERRRGRGPGHPARRRPADQGLPVRPRRAASGRG